MASHTTTTPPAPPLDLAQREEAERQMLDQKAREAAEPAVFTRSWPVGDRTVTLTAPLPPTRKQMRDCTIVWSPDEPRSLDDEELRQYRAGRIRASIAYGLQPLVVR